MQNMKIQIKHNPSDFIVKEITKLDSKKGSFLYIELTKTNCNTLDVIAEISKKLNIPRKLIGYSGNKDKFAVTTQYISIFKGNPDKIKQLKIEGVILKLLHFGSKPILLGSLRENYFRITLPINFRIKPIKKLVNYYGEQRFSSNNADVGKAILKQDYKEACRLINTNNINSFLNRNPEQYKNALKSLAPEMLLLYINAFQSYLWNEVAKQFIKDNFKNAREFQGLLFVENPKINIEIPLITFDTFIKQKNLRTYYNNLLRKENISQEDYYLYDFPELTRNTAYRQLFVDVKNFRINKNVIEFILPAGSYGTIVIKHIEAFL